MLISPERLLGCLVGRQVFLAVISGGSPVGGGARLRNTQDIGLFSRAKSGDIGWGSSNPPTGSCSRRGLEQRKDRQLARACSGGQACLSLA